MSARQPAAATRRHDAPAADAVAADKWLRRFRAILAAILGGVVAGIGALAFYTSFEAIKSYATRSGGIQPSHGWAIPLLVDSFIVVATGADLWFTTTTKRQRHLWELWWPRVLLVGAAAVSFVLNVAHAQAGNWAARGVAAIPPAALVLGVELLMLVLRRATTLRAERLAAGLTAAEPAITEPAADHPGGTAAQPAPPAPPTRRQPARRQANQTGGPRRRALAVLRQDPGISGGRLGRAVGMSERWGRNIRPALVAELAATSAQGGNGNGDHAAAAGGVLALPAPAAEGGSDAPA